MANFRYAADNRFILNIDENLLYDKKNSLTSNKVIQFQNNAKRVPDFITLLRCHIAYIENQ
ncbi:hypothetical protein, partial [Hoylesella timonensis]|uniref:hypothetical protein n=1 Tax=Hoylesella timonensis TaxID=386414 RepID=UPI00242FF373